MAADTARRLPVWGQRVYVGQPWACMLWQQHGHCAVQQDRDWSGQREPAWREAPLTRQHRYFLICPFKHFDIIRPHRATSTLIILTFGTAAKWAKEKQEKKKVAEILDRHQIMVDVWNVGMVIWWVLSRPHEHTNNSDQLQQGYSNNTELCERKTTSTTGQTVPVQLFRIKEYFENYFPQVHRQTDSSLYEYLRVHYLNTDLNAFITHPSRPF